MGLVSFDCAHCGCPTDVEDGQPPERNANGDPVCDVCAKHPGDQVVTCPGCLCTVNKDYGPACDGCGKPVCEECGKGKPTLCLACRVKALEARVDDLTARVPPRPPGVDPYAASERVGVDPTGGCVHSFGGRQIVDPSSLPTQELDAEPPCCTRTRAAEAEEWAARLHVVEDERDRFKRAIVSAENERDEAKDENEERAQAWADAMSRVRRLQEERDEIADKLKRETTLSHERGKQIGDLAAERNALAKWKAEVRESMRGAFYEAGGTPLAQPDGRAETPGKDTT